MQPNPLLETKMASLVEAAKKEGLLQHDKIRGCSSEEIDALEARYSVVLPEAYKLYLATMGQESGDFNSYFFLSSYADVLKLTEEIRGDIALWKYELSLEREDAEEEGREFAAFGTLPIDNFELPANALIIARARQDSIYFYYMECGAGEDGRVYFVNLDALEKFGSETYDSLFDYWQACITVIR